MVIESSVLLGECRSLCAGKTFAGQDGSFMEKEIWKGVDGYLGYYEVSNRGKVRSLVRVVRAKNRWGGVSLRQAPSVVLRPGQSNTGYLVAALSKNGRVKGCLVHRLVCAAFHSNPNASPVVNHKDGNKINNTAGNLEYVTHSENIRHAFDIGLKSGRSGEQNPRSRLSAVQVMQIRARIEAGEKVHVLAPEFRVSYGCIYGIWKKTRWTK